MYRMVHVYVQVVLKGFLVILVGLANEQQTKDKKSRYLHSSSGLLQT